MIQLLLNINNLLLHQFSSAAKVDTKSLRTYRKLVVIISLILFFPNVLWLADLPDKLFSPPELSFTSILKGFPNYSVLFILHLITLISLVLLGLNIHSRISGITHALSLILLYGLQFSFGKIDHIIILPLTFLCLSIDKWGIETSKNTVLPISGETLLAIFISFGMFTAGFPKLLNWFDLDLNTSGFLHWFYPGYFNSNRTHLLANSVFMFPTFLLEIIDYTAILFELIPFLLLLSGKKKLWQLWLIIASIFHLLNTLLLNISFSIHSFIFILYLLPQQVNNTLCMVKNRNLSLFILFAACIQLFSIIQFNKTLVQWLFTSSKYRLVFDMILWSSITILGFFKIFEKDHNCSLDLNEG
ncbi:hypothetical protein [Sediminitomix flava]|uniref:HTTM domain-containing protein n=1 Tax=Sediminitomix flava TaxID=379075 RepID=A0A315ZHY9_SEDFL|nr:hypothetical protein [Sediminitomix flava]PWJ44720.1 hypothetical protein BC781_1011091 [Sediminitomix flava]